MFPFFPFSVGMLSFSSYFFPAGGRVLGLARQALPNLVWRRVAEGRDLFCLMVFFRDLFASAKTLKTLE